MPEMTVRRPVGSPGRLLPVPLLTAANVLVWVVVSLQLAHSLV